jgi:FixJ family two-component response regulator
MVERKLVSVVDDDESVRESLPDLLRSFGFDVEAFASAEAYLAAAGRTRADCLVLDIAMPGMSGPELQIEVARRGERIPIVFITARRDDEAIAELLRRGAAACLIKPFEAAAIVDAVNAALGKE